MFHIPEQSRIPHPWDLPNPSQMGNNGAFRIPSPEPGWVLYLICSDGLGWEHVSVHAAKGNKTRTPTWKEMCAVKQTCWDRSDVVVQYHPAETDYVNDHPNVLHLWRPIERPMPMPQKVMV